MYMRHRRYNTVQMDTDAGMTQSELADQVSWPICPSALMGAGFALGFAVFRTERVCGPHSAWKPGYK
jgi:hypothetical protein